MRMSADLRRQVNEIESARAVLNPSPVDAHHVPDWLRRRAMKRFGCNRGDTTGWGVLFHAVRQVDPTGKATCAWLDHWGVTPWHGKTALAAEPYSLSADDVASIDRFARELGIEWRLSSNSWWFPGRTIRVLFFEAEQEGKAA